MERDKTQVPILRTNNQQINKASPGSRADIGMRDCDDRVYEEARPSLVRLETFKMKNFRPPMDVVKVVQKDVKIIFF